MYQRKIPIDYTCGQAVAMEVLGSKWKFCLLYEISKGYTRPRDLLKVIQGITKRVLHQQLCELEFHGLVSKVVYSEMPLRAEYSLTTTGLSALPLIVAMDQWGLSFAPQLKALLDPAPAEVGT